MYGAGKENEICWRNNIKDITMDKERKTIYLCLAHMSENGMEQKYVKEAFDTNWVVPLGPNVNGFEDDLKSFVSKKVMELTCRRRWWR